MANETGSSAVKLTMIVTRGMAALNVLPSGNCTSRVTGHVGGTSCSSVICSKPMFRT